MVNSFEGCQLGIAAFRKALINNNPLQTCTVPYPLGHNHLLILNINIIWPPWTHSIRKNFLSFHCCFTWRKQFEQLFQSVIIYNLVTCLVMLGMCLAWQHKTLKARNWTTPNLPNVKPTGIHLLVTEYVSVPISQHLNTNMKVFPTNHLGLGLSWSVSLVGFSPFVYIWLNKNVKINSVHQWVLLLR